MRKTLFYILVLGFMTLPVLAKSAPADPLKVGVSPNGENSISLAVFWIPFLDQLETESGIPLRFATAPDLLEFNQRLAAGEYDLVITDQYVFTIFRQKHKLSYLAELSTSQQAGEMVLVANTDIKELGQIEGGLLAVKQDEKAGNIKALDKHLSASGVTAVRDNLLSYQKILQSLAENLHVAGLVPVSELNKMDKPLSILWRHANNNSYIMTFPQSTSIGTVEKLAETLEAFNAKTEIPAKASKVHVKSVSDLEQARE